MGLAGSKIIYICLFCRCGRVQWEYASRINDPVYLFVMYSTSHPPPAIICILRAYIIAPPLYVFLSPPPPGCPTYGTNAVTLPLKILRVGLCSTNQRLHRYPVITSLFYVRNPGILGLHRRKESQLPNKCPPSPQRWSGPQPPPPPLHALLYFSPALLYRLWETERG